LWSSCPSPLAAHYAILLLSPDAVAVSAGRFRRQIRFGLGLAAEFALRSRQGTRTLSRIHQHLGLRRNPWLRRDLRQRTPPKRLRADAVAERRRRSADAADESLQ